MLVSLRGVVAFAPLSAGWIVAAFAVVGVMVLAPTEPSPPPGYSLSSTSIFDALAPTTSGAAVLLEKKRFIMWEIEVGAESESRWLTAAGVVGGSCCFRWDLFDTHARRMNLFVVVVIVVVIVVVVDDFVPWSLPRCRQQRDEQRDAGG